MKEKRKKIVANIFTLLMRFNTLRIYVAINCGNAVSVIMQYQFEIIWFETKKNAIERNNDLPNL